MVAHNGFTYDLTYEQKAKNLLHRLAKVDGDEKAREMATHFLDIHGEINAAFVRELTEYVFDAEQEAYSQ